MNRTLRSCASRAFIVSDFALATDFKDSKSSYNHTQVVYTTRTCTTPPEVLTEVFAQGLPQPRRANATVPLRLWSWTAEFSFFNHNLLDPHHRKFTSISLLNNNLNAQKKILQFQEKTLQQTQGRMRLRIYFVRTAQLGPGMWLLTIVM